MIRSLSRALGCATTPTWNGDSGGRRPGAAALRATPHFLLRAGIHRFATRAPGTPTHWCCPRSWSLRQAVEAKRARNRLGRGPRSWDRCDGHRLSDQHFPRLRCALEGARIADGGRRARICLRSLTGAGGFATCRISSSRAAAVAWPCRGRSGAPRGADSGDPTPIAHTEGALPLRSIGVDLAAWKREWAAKPLWSYYVLGDARVCS